MNELSATRSERWRQRAKQLVALLRRAVPFGSGVLAAFLGLLLYNAVTPKPHLITPDEVNQSVNNILASATPPAAYSAYVYQIIRPSLVYIRSRLPDQDGQPDGAVGSGVIVTDTGDILTALHVVADATSIQVTFADGTEANAQISATQPEIDIAVLATDRLPSEVVPAILGNPGAMHVGDEAYVVGNPFGIYGSMSTGVISGFDRSFQDAKTKRKMEGLIQIDAAVNPGNSGGPLLNRAGQVVGIVTALLNPTQQEVFIGIGFAVPITTAGGAAGLPPY
ncbi:MAG: trypsin-like peptidase domain-containing protein [Anaerolineae bacterium]|nr:trypsin-like peptidase domain-containing protein [Anaerolineae bacterium]